MKLFRRFYLHQDVKINCILLSLTLVLKFIRFIGMHVRSTPIVNEELDYASLCAQLQTKLADIERECLHREAELSERLKN